MSDKGNKIKHYSAEQIRLYIEGKLSPSEMHAIEKAALNDPFLADALEGMEVHHQQSNVQSFEQGSAELKSRLNDRIRKRREAIVFDNQNLWWKAAAVLLLLTSGIAITFFMSEKNRLENVRIVKNETINDSGRKSQELNEPPVQYDSPSVSEATRVKKPSVARVPGKKEYTEKSEEITAKDENRLQKAPAAVVPDRKAQPKTNDSLQAPVVAKETEISASDSPGEQLQGRAAGMEISSRKESAEVVVVGYGSKKRNRNISADEADGKKTKKRIMPAGGWDAFDEYIASNRHVMDSLGAGIEKLYFDVDSSGRPSRIRIIQSISPAHDREAVRLINEGPSWIITRGERRDITLDILY